MDFLSRTKKVQPLDLSGDYESIKLRDKAKSNATQLTIQGEDASIAWAEYRHLRIIISNKIKFEEKNFKKKEIIECMNDPSKCWAKTKEFMNWGTGSGPPIQLQIDGKLISKASSITTAMNEYFIGRVLAIRNEIKSIPPNLVKCYEIMRGKKCKLWLGYITQDRVTKLLKSLKKSKSCAIDGLDSYSLQVSAEYISGPLHHIITLSMMQQKFPSAWKYSKIIPLHKKASRLDRQNYRPVAILSPLSKILEKIVFQQIYDFFTKNKIFTDSLHGYRNNRSTHTTLLTMYDRWVRAAARGDLSGAVLIALSAAFDLVDH